MQLQARLHDPRLWATSSGYTACNSKKSLTVGIASPTAEAAPTPFSPTLNITAWQHELINDPDCEFILDGIKFGFKIIEPPDMDGNIEMNNYKSTREHATLVEAEIQKKKSWKDDILLPLVNQRLWVHLELYPNQMVQFVLYMMPLGPPVPQSMITLLPCQNNASNPFKMS